LVDALGYLVRFILLPGQRHDSVGVEPLIEDIDFEALIADKAFDQTALRRELNDRGALAVIPSKKDRKTTGSSSAFNSETQRCAKAWPQVLTANSSSACSTRHPQHRCSRDGPRTGTVERYARKFPTTGVVGGALRWYHPLGRRAKLGRFYRGFLKLWHAFSQGAVVLWLPKHASRADRTIGQ